MKNIVYGTKNGDHEYASFRPVGTKVLLKKYARKLVRAAGAIIVPEEVRKNNSFGLAYVVELGDDEQCRDSGLKPGDRVLYDYWSVYHDNDEYVLTNVENIILRLDEKEAEMYANGVDIWNRQKDLN